MVKQKTRTLTPAEYDAIVTALPVQHRLMIETAINAGLRWGEFIALSRRQRTRTMALPHDVVDQLAEWLTLFIWIPTISCLPPGRNPGDFDLESVMDRMGPRNLARGVAISHGREALE